MPRSGHTHTGTSSILRREKDVDEVLQTTTVYSNVSKAVLASREDLKQVFGTDDEEAVCKFILAHGDLQVSDRERKLELDTKFRDVAAVISEKCVNPTTSRPYTIPMLERALKDIHFSVDSNRPAKIQAFEVRGRGGGALAAARGRSVLRPVAACRLAAPALVAQSRGRQHREEQAPTSVPPSSPRPHVRRCRRCKPGSPSSVRG